MRVFGIAIALVLLLVIAVFVYVGSNTNSIVQNAIEVMGPEYLGAAVRLDAVDISLRDGRGTLTGLEIDNPPGFEGPYAMRVGTVSIKVDLAKSNSGLIVLNGVDIEDARVAAIVKSPNDTNIRTLATHTPASGSSPIKFVIDRLDLTGAQASVSSPLLTAAKEIDLPDVHLRNIGRSSGGVGAGEVIDQILAPIAKAVSQSLGETGIRSLLGDPNKAQSDAAQRLNDTLHSLGHPGH
jgi:hypothetical protein